jgi:hypothetical protein
VARRGKPNGSDPESERAARSEGSSPLPDAARFSSLVGCAGRLYRQRFRPLTLLFAAIYTPLYLVFAGVLALTADTASGATTSSSGFALVYLFQVILPALLGTFAIASAAVILAMAVVGRRARARDAAHVLRPRASDVLPSAMLSTLLAVMCTFLPFGSLAIAPFLFGPPVLVHVLTLEEKSFQESWPRARWLLSGHWMRLIGYLLTISLGLGLIQLTLAELSGYAAAALGDVASLIAFSIVRGIAVGVTLPYLAAAMLVLYLDLRVRKDQLDLEAFETELNSMPVPRGQ